jgi:hypothetical protein
MSSTIISSTSAQMRAKTGKRFVARGSEPQLMGKVEKIWAFTF